MSAEEAQNDREGRAARNQALFREINERVNHLNGSFSVDLPLDDFICECANDECADRIALSVEEYELLRQDGRRFCVAPSEDHVWSGDVERVVERKERYWVVEKVDEAGRIALGLNPRERRLH